MFSGIVFFLAVLGQLLSANGDCVWYDQCGYDPNDTLQSLPPLNCKYEGPPIKVQNNESMNLLELTCPHLVDASKEAGGLCCSQSQLTDLLKNFKIPEIMLGRCPICLLNFKRYFCDMTCHPDQSSFIKVTETKAVDSRELVQSIEYAVNEKFISGIYNSCYEVYSPQTSSRAMRLMCGQWGDSLCTPLRWFSYLGDKSNGRTPIQITVKSLAKGGHNPPVFPCYSNNASVQSCACSDCKQACPTLNSEEEYKELLNYESSNPPIYYGIAILLSSLLGLGTIFLLAVRFKAKNKISSETPTLPLPETPNQSFRTRLYKRTFGNLGIFCARHAVIVLVSNCILFIALSTGVFWLKITSEPIELWSSPSSRSRQERDFFNNHFEPFFRTSIVIIKAAEDRSRSNNFAYRNLYGENASFSRIFQEDILYQVLKLQKEIENISAEDGTSLSDVCYKPLAPEIPTCLIQSIWNYWQVTNSSFNLKKSNENGHTDTYLDHLTTCVKNPYTIKSSTAMGQSCLSKGFVPLEAKFVMGGYGEDESSPNILSNSSALIMTFLLKNHVEPEKIEKAVQWERAFVDWMSNNLEEYPLLDIAFIAEMSIQDAIESNSKGDVVVVIISYTLMFIYVAFALTDFRSSLHWGLTLALAGIALVLASILSTTGLFGFLGVKATMIIFEIVPFLVLAVGIDNIFVLATTARQKMLSLEGKETDVEHIIGETLEEVAPGMLTSTLAQACAFYLGTLSQMPAVITFAIYAGTSILINFAAQITGFVAVLALDLKRIKNRRLDIFCCIKSKNYSNDNFKDSGFDYQKSIAVLFKDYISPFLMKNMTVKFTIMSLIIAFLSINLTFAFYIQVGLDPESTMPEGSYVKKYFEWLKIYYSVGPPVYFVLNSSNIDLASVGGQNKLCGSASCNADSFQTALKLWSTQPDLTSIATSGQSWIDDYFTWSKDCCKADESGDICYDDGEDYASAYAYDYADYSSPDEIDKGSCNPCSNGHRINGSAFTNLLDTFLGENPNEECPKGGKIYKDSIYQSNGSVIFSNFMAFHTVLRTSNDFVRAIESSRILSDKYSSETNSTIFPYSIFHVYYEQYLTMKGDTLISLAFVLLSIFLICWILSGRVSVGCFTVLFVASVLVNVVGFISFLGIQLNAILAVNLLVACGISVEICIGYLTSVLVNRRSPVEAFNELSSVLFSGIHITNILGVSVLGFSQSNIFFYYFFVVYMSIVIIGLIHGIIVLPVLLSFFY